MDKIELEFLYAIRLHAQFEEVWLPVKGYSNYEVSSRGQVRNTSKKVLKPQRAKIGYDSVFLCKNGVVKKLYVHRLVCSAFWPNTSNKPSVDHADGNRSNNDINNVRWATVHENNRNKSMHRNNTSGVIGVHWSKIMKKWHAVIYIGVHKNLGYFHTLKAAKKARVSAENKLFGVFAKREV